jgi:uracil-DNA glycosylase family 4
MGFFDIDKKALETKPAPKPHASKVKTYTLGCDGCPLRECWPRITSPRMQLQGPANADILIVGSFPLLTADQAGTPFTKEHRDQLWSLIPRQHRERVAWQNAVRCHPIGTSVGARETHACSTYLAEDIERLPIKAVLLLGPVPLDEYFGVAQSKDMSGIRFPLSIAGKTVWGYSVFHPHDVANMAGSFDAGPMEPLLRADIKKFFAEIDRWPTPVVQTIKQSDVLLPTTLEEALAIVDQMDGVLGWDIETHSSISGLKPWYEDSIILISAFSDGQTTMAFSVDHPTAPTDWGFDFMEAVVTTRPWIAHNANFERKWILWQKHKRGCKQQLAPFHDSEALARVRYQRSGLGSLEKVSRIELGANIKALSHVDARAIMSFPLADVLPYCGIDAWASARIYHSLIDRVQPEQYQKLLDTIQSTTDMELLGLPVDLNEANRQAHYWNEKSIRIARDASTLYEVREFERQKQRPFQISSGVDIGEALVEFGRVSLPKTKGGKQFATDEAALLENAVGNPFGQAVIDFREASKMASTYVNPILDTTKHTDGMLHSGYTSMHTHTLRLSAFDPNIQNYPKRNAEQKQLRKQVKAPPGCVFVAIDQGQLQARIIAMATRDRAFCASFLKNIDIHYVWLDKCLAIDPDYHYRLIEVAGLRSNASEKEIRKAGRTIIKTDFVFASFFGSGAPNISTRTKIPLRLVQQLHEELWAEFPDVRKWIKQQRQEYRETGSVRTLNGMVRHGILYGNEPLNGPIQGSEGEIMLPAMNDLARMAREQDDVYLHPRMNVHDDLSFFLPDDERCEQYIKTIAEVMLRVRYHWQIVPLTVEVSVGSNWYDVEEVAVIKGDYVR